MFLITSNLKDALPRPRNQAGKLPPSRIHGTLLTTPLEIGPENSFNYPPPRIHGTSLTTPPRNRAGKLLQLPPPLSLSNSRNFIDYPPSNFHPATPLGGDRSHTFLFRKQKQTLASATTPKDLGKLFFIPSYATATGSNQSQRG